MAPRVLVDNQASALHTVIEVNGRDRPGLLFELTRELTRLNLQVSSAKISTYGEKVVDVFYVKNLFGHKVEHPAKLAEIRATLEAVLAKGNDAGSAVLPKGPAVANQPKRSLRSSSVLSGTGLLAQIFEEFFDAGEKAFAFGVGPAAFAFLFEFAQQFLLALGQVDRGLDHRLDEHVAAQRRAQHRHALAAEPELMARLGPGGHRDAWSGCPRRSAPRSSRRAPPW